MLNLGSLSFRLRTFYDVNGRLHSFYEMMNSWDLLALSDCVDDDSQLLPHQILAQYFKSDIMTMSFGWRQSTVAAIINWLNSKNYWGVDVPHPVNHFCKFDSNPPSGPVIKHTGLSSFNNTACLLNRNYALWISLSYKKWGNQHSKKYLTFNDGRSRTRFG